MPRGDGTGPAGMGPMTGRGAGYCAGYATPGFANYGRGGFIRGMGGGRGFRRVFYQTGVPGWGRDGGQMPYETAYDEKTTLKNQEEVLETQLRHVKERLKEFSEE